MGYVTYNLASDDTDVVNISKVRLELGDMTPGSGVKPDGSNFSDAEIAAWLEEEGDHVFHAVIRACDALARMWSPVVTEQTGPRRMEYSKVADNWKAQAQTLRDMYGNPAVSGSSAFAVPSARSDGYSEAAAEEE